MILAGKKPMSRRRNKAATDEHVDTHRWVVSYADFITLLFAFFVVMYAMSSVNQEKYKSLSEGMHSAFNNKDQHKSQTPNEKSKDGPNPIDEPNPKGGFGDGLDGLNSALNEFKNIEVQISRQDGWINMDIKAGSLFSNGTSELTSEAMISLINLAHKIKDIPYAVAVEGYTDNVPINAPEYKSNWELSAARAAAIGRVLNTYGVASERLLIIGYGDQFPLMDNATEVGRSQNRRVNIVLTKDSIVKRMPTQIDAEENQMQSKIEPISIKSGKNKRH